MKKMIAQTKEKCDEALTKLGLVTMNWAWWQWTLWYAAWFFVGFGGTSIVMALKNRAKG